MNMRCIFMMTIITVLKITLTWWFTDSLLGK